MTSSSQKETKQFALFQLPKEIMSHVVCSFLTASDLSRIEQTTKKMQTFCAGASGAWQTVFSQSFSGHVAYQKALASRGRALADDSADVDEPDSEASDDKKAATTADSSSFAADAKEALASESGEVDWRKLYKSVLGSVDLFNKNHDE